MNKQGRRRRLAAAFIALLPAAAQALSLRHSARDLAAERLKPDRSAPVGESPGGALRIANAGAEEARVSVRFEAPSPGELLDGYEPIPDPGWLRAAATLVLRPGDSAPVPAAVRIPAGAQAPPGAQYQAAWVSRAESPGGMRLELRSRVLLRVDDEEPAGARRPRPGWGFELLPEQADAGEQPVGRLVPLEGAGVRLKIANPNPGRATFAVRVLRGAPPGAVARAAPPPDPGFLKVEPRRLELEPGSVGELRLALDAPGQARYRGRRWEFTVEVEMLESETPRPRHYRLLVETED